MQQLEKIKTKVGSIIAVILLLVVIIAPIIYTFNPAVQRSVKKIYYRIQSYNQYPADVKLSVPYYKQEHALSCEVASLKMALDYYQVNISENDLISQLNFDARGSRSRGNIWGDPDIGFVGNIDGKIPNGGYGVYEDPIVALALKYRDAQKITGSSLADVLYEISSNHPVIVWGSVASGRDISWQTKDGKKIKAIYGEHVRLLIGYSGTIDKPTAVILHDPIYGTIGMSAKNFIKDWALLDNKAVVIY